MRTSKGKKSSSPRRRSSEARALRALPSKVIPNKKPFYFKDTSGTITKEELEAFLEEISDIITNGG
jgi:predicted metal-dependent peptidase